MRYLSHVPRDGAPATIEVARYEMRSGERFGFHRHDCHQLAWSASGVLRTMVGDDAWVLPSTLALWIPAGADHDVGCARDAAFFSLYVPSETSPIAWTEPTVVAVTPLLRALVERLTDDQLTTAQRFRAERVVFDELEPLTVAPLRVPMPVDPRARAVAQALVDDPSDDRTIDEWGRFAGANRRTLARLFTAETGMSFANWRTQVRLQAALVHLAAGTPTTVVAARVGYRNVSAFGAAFQRVVGQTPSTYFTKVLARTG
jgi:AraC-like DNA-binding protein/quercetin dioxygenase-like cupin family protein